MKALIISMFVLTAIVALALAILVTKKPGPDNRVSTKTVSAEIVEVTLKDNSLQDGLSGYVLGKALGLPSGMTAAASFANSFQSCVLRLKVEAETEQNLALIEMKDSKCKEFTVGDKMEVKKVTVSRFFKDGWIDFVYYRF